MRSPPYGHLLRWQRRGDWWAVALTQTAVYNVFHHNYTLQLACHLQADASPCWYPETETITDAEAHNFATSSHPGLWLDQATGRLYLFVNREGDETVGVACIDTTEAAIDENPFCGFTPLSGAGEAAYEGISAPALVGSRWYAFNYVSGAKITGSKNKLLCFDVNTLSGCPGQPFAVSSDTRDVEGGYPTPAVTAIGSKVIVPLQFQFEQQLACFDGNTQSACSGSWPVDVPEGIVYNSQAGPAFPLLSGSGTINGLCLPTGGDPCFDLIGSPVATPAGLAEAVPPTSEWNGPALRKGTRVYVPNGGYNEVNCYDYALSEGCAGFPMSFENLYLLYTVNPDPERPRCLWVNSDSGAWQIQTFDAYTGGTCE
jgi:hypothetical protein